MLYLIATPIGNLSDISLRAIDTLRSSDYILCEDTRRSQILLKHFDIKKPLKAYHQFNEIKSQKKILDDLKNGLTISLLSDAGTPGISDPGYLLIQACHQESIPYTLIPGPCAPIHALILSGFKTDKFQFLGFLPKKVSELKETILDLLQYPGTSICFESAQRISHTLKIFNEFAKDRSLAIARELTKIHEECRVGTAKELLEHNFKGEIVLLISGYEQRPLEYTMTPEEHVKQLQEEFGISKKEAIKMAAKLRGVPKKQIYH